MIIINKQTKDEYVILGSGFGGVLIANVKTKKIEVSSNIQLCLKYELGEILK